jgi:exodeoxyribonuclease V alpha subunit
MGCKLQVSKRTGQGDLLDMAERLQRGEGGGYPITSWGEGLTRRAEWIEMLSKRLPSPLYSAEPDPNTCFEAQKKVRLLAILRQGPFGTQSLNRVLLDSFVAKAVEGQWLAIPILITQNDAKKQIYNGTPGVLIRKAGARHSTAYLQIGGELRKVPEAALPSYEIAFCLSVHKSQGSEFEEVIALFPPGSERFGREALYTAVTRAKKKVELVIEEETLNKALAATARRQSGFVERFSAAYN